MLARRLIFAVSLFLNVVLAYTLIWGEKGVIAYKALRERCASLEVIMEKVGEDNLNLSREIRLLQSDDKYLEKVIRNRLNFVRENELLYIFPDETPIETPGAPSHE
jgi:cell division protein FtsB